jgi:large subunit ribosomal protein L7/L12
MNNTNTNLIIQNLKNLSLLELNNLIIEIETSFSIKASLFNTDSIKNNESTFNNSVAEIKEEKSLFTITLTAVPQDKKISVLKIVRTITGFGLKESKDIVDNLPKILKENISKDECNKIKQEIESVGGTLLIS